MGPRAGSTLAAGDKKREQEEHVQTTESRELSALDETCFCHSRLKAKSVGTTPKILSLKVGATFLYSFINGYLTKLREMPNLE